MTDDPVVKRHRHLEQIAMAALDVGRLLSETGAKTSVVAAGMAKIAGGLGAERVHSRIGYASIALTVTHGENTITRMVGVGPLGVNMRFNHELRALCQEVGKGGLGVEEVRGRMKALREKVPHHPRVLIALAAGVACAAFGRLLGVDWAAMLPIMAASTIGQWLRMSMTRRGVNAFVMTAIVAFVAALLAGTSAIAAGSAMVPMAMTASVLLLVPGVPAMNAQTDIMEGYPTMGSARFVTVAMLLMFITLGLAAAQALMHGGAGYLLHLHHGVAHQGAFGAIAAAGFGVLFNFGPSRLAWSAAAGALALSLRTLGLEAGWSLEVASFAAAAVVALAAEALRFAPLEVRRPRSVLAIAGCIPMIPGGAATSWIIGLMELTAQNPVDPAASLQVAVSAGLRVVFTIGAIGAALTMVRSLVSHSEFP
ncbi:threonine/serine exporter family protein [Tropicimonas sp. IMCC6043]|uniref:threonine/serine exporter family protein n=1 Tax=Tropicimonas sp. IMCC6043 TaxID=2510645 RepID=UPI00101BF028|nr:threonine/serine exporter family protein [Tropicimonas sp. IMCC6043]RYH06956.1 threonine/serine exporter [Tropicimonas sp. IMCC6043]